MNILIIILCVVFYLFIGKCMDRVCDHYFNSGLLNPASSVIMMLFWPMLIVEYIFIKLRINRLVDKVSYWIIRDIDEILNKSKN